VEPFDPVTAGIAEPQILFERRGVTALVKPAGLPTQAPSAFPSLEAWLRGRLPPGAYLGIPHRLDRAVSGVMLMATTPRAARKLSRQFERREVEKTYVAILAPRPDAGAWAVGERREWIDRLAKVPDEPRAHVVADDDPLGREARATARLLARLPDGAGPGGERLLLELHPHTGRMHQLRLQAARRGYPVVGDALYGGPASPAAGREAPIALHALAIRFRDPDDGGPVEARAPLPEGWPAAARRALEPPPADQPPA
jgi:23S rRNA-/tRNA-specific pseudouridylate synthase